MNVDVAPPANLQPPRRLPFGQSYWNYFPDLVQDKILKMVHKALLEEVFEEMFYRFYCTQCGDVSYEVFFKKCECDCDCCTCDFGDDDSWLDFVCDCVNAGEECICDAIEFRCEWCGCRCS